MITTKSLIEFRNSVAEKSIEGLRQFGHVEPVVFLLLPENGKIRPLAISIRDLEGSGYGFNFLKIAAHEKGAIGFILVAQAIRVDKVTEECEEVLTINFETSLITELLTYKIDLLLDEAMPTIAEVSNIERGNFSGILYNFNLN